MTNKKSFFGFFVEKHKISWLLLIAIVVVGLNAFSTLPREIQPEINIPFASVSVALPGASPLDTESLLTEPLEKEIAGVADIKLLTSTSGFGFSSIFIEFEASVDLDRAVDEVKDAVDRVKPTLPEDATDPVVSKAEPNAFAIMTFSLVGDLPSYELSKIAENIKDELEAINLVSRVDVLGAQEKIVEIVLDPDKINDYGLSLAQVSQILEFSNFNLPIGLINSDKLNYSVRVDNRFYTLEEIQNLPLMSLSDDVNETILVKDVAQVQESLTSKVTISKVSTGGQEALPAISLQIYKKDSSDVVGTATAAKERIEELKVEGKVPEGVEIIITNDNSVFVEEELGNLTNNGLQTAIFIIISLFLALGLTQGIISGLAIPLTFLMTFPIFQLLGMSFNTLSLFSLVMSLGITIDTTVVIMEGIYENLKKGYTPKESALRSIEAYKWPLIAGTATNIFAFFPMLLVSGILGEFLKTMPITITAALITSLLLSLTIIPALTARFIKVRKDAKEHHSILEPFFHRIGASFEKIIRAVLHRRMWRVLILLIVFVAFALSLMLPASGLLQVEMFPKTDQNYFTVRIEKPVGTVIDETRKSTEDVEEYLYTIPEVDNFITQIGTNQSVGLSGDPVAASQALNESHFANITVNLVAKEERDIKSFDIAADVREHFATYVEADIFIEELQEGPPSEDPITIRLHGEDLETLKEMANNIKGIVESVDGTTNTTLSLEPGQNEFIFTLDREKLSLYQLSVPQVAALIRSNIQGVKSTNIKLAGDEDTDIYLRYGFEDRSAVPNLSFEEIKGIKVPTPQGFSVELGDLAAMEFEKSPSFIEREDQKRIIKVRSAIEADADLVTINTQIEEEIAKLELPNGYEINFGGDLEEINESFRELFQSMIVGIILITFSLVLMFNSFKQPLIVMLTLPLALIGVFPGLYLIGLKLSFPSFLGVVSLGGIVVSNTIVLIDRINENRKNGVEFKEAIAEATNSRIEPIFMTTLSTILGVIPLSLANAFWAGLGFTIAFGQLFSTVLLLLVIPILYYMIEIRAERKRLRGEANVN